MPSRRGFLGAAALSAATESFGRALLADPSLAFPLDQDQLDQSVINFWTSEIKEPYEAFQEFQKFQKRSAANPGEHHPPPPPPPPPPPSYQPEFVYYGGPGKFLTSSEIKTDDLPAAGQANISLSVTGFRLSDSNKMLVASAASGSLRIDVKQTTPLPSLQEALAWTAVAGLLPRQANPFPDLNQLNFNTGKAWTDRQQIPLSNGLGFWAWNFFVKPKESTLSKLLGFFRSLDKAAPFVFPLLGLPAIGLTALTAVSKFVGYLQAEGDSKFLFKSDDSPVFATKEGQAANRGPGLPLKTGDYLVVPRDKLSDFGHERKNLDLMNGYLVPTGTDPFDVFSVAPTQIQNVDYLSLHVEVTVEQTKST